MPFTSLCSIFLFNFLLKIPPDTQDLNAYIGDDLSKIYFDKLLYKIIPTNV